MLSCGHRLSKVAWRNAIVAGRVDAYSIPHRAIASLPLVPHPQQRRVAGVDEVNDPHISLAGVFPVQPARVLRLPPRTRLSK